MLNGEYTTKSRSKLTSFFILFVAAANKGFESSGILRFATGLGSTAVMGSSTPPVVCVRVPLISCLHQTEWLPQHSVGVGRDDERQS